MFSINNKIHKVITLTDSWGRGRDRYTHKNELRLFSAKEQALKVVNNLRIAGEQDADVLSAQHSMSPGRAVLQRG